MQELGQVQMLAQMQEQTQKKDYLPELVRV